MTGREQKDSFKVSAGYAEDRSGRESVTVRPFQIRGRFLTALAIRIKCNALDASFYEALDERLQATPQFFKDAPVVLDFGEVPNFVDMDVIRGLVDNLRRRKLMVFGVENARTVTYDALQIIGLIPIQSRSDASGPNEKSSRPRQIEKLLPPDNKIISAPVRSGQMVVTERGDLTVIGSVASGAELIAGGNIHVYGTLRGRAMAGVHGDQNARIFCQNLDAELVAIAGLYQTSETFKHAQRNRCMQIYLEDETLRMEVLV